MFIMCYRSPSLYQAILFRSWYMLVAQAHCQPPVFRLMEWFPGSVQVCTGVHTHMYRYR